MQTTCRINRATTYLEVILLGCCPRSPQSQQQNAVVALGKVAWGLDAVYIHGGIPQRRPVEVAAELGLPPHVFALFGLAIGHPDPARPADVKPRLPQDAVLFKEQYEWGERQRAGIAAYDEHLRSFQREQNLPERDWTEQAGTRVRGAGSLSGRDVLRDVLHHLGFALR